MKREKKTSKRKLSSEQQVRAELMALGQILEETSQQYVLRLQREILGVVQQVPERRGRQGLLPKEEKKLRLMLELLGSLHIKPNKGRRKDLKRIDELIGELENLVLGK